MTQLSLCDAKTHLSSLVDRAAAGEELVIAKNGVPMARLVGLPRRDQPRVPINALGITYVSPDFDQTDAETLAQFNDAP